MAGCEPVMVLEMHVCVSTGEYDATCYKLPCPGQLTRLDPQLPSLYGGVKESSVFTGVFQELINAYLFGTHGFCNN